MTMDPIVYVMLACLHPTIAPSVTVCHVAHVYAKQTDCDMDAARLARNAINKKGGASSTVPTQSKSRPSACPRSGLARL